MEFGKKIWNILIPKFKEFIAWIISTESDFTASQAVNKDFICSENAAKFLYDCLLYSSEYR